MSATTTRVRRVLICEDSRTYAAALSELLERDHEIDVVGVCENAEQAISHLSSLRPDLVTMDLELPGMSGVDAIEQIMGVLPVPILVLSGHVEHRSERALSALAAGALEALPKAELNVGDLDGVAAKELRQRIKLLSEVKVIRHPRASLSRRTGPATWSRTASVIGICASTGGPRALATVLAGVPATFPIPILVVQHMASGFIESFARWLDHEVPLRVQMAVPDTTPAPGVWIAPDTGHLVLSEHGRLALDSTTAAGPHCPSGDVLLRSLATVSGPETVGIVLTGMGRDGAEGLRDVRRAGGLTIAQDEATSAVFGMPQAASECGSELVLPLDSIALWLRALRPPAGAR